MYICITCKYVHVHLQLINNKVYENNSLQSCHYFHLIIHVAFITMLLMTLYQYNTHRHTLFLFPIVSVYFKTCLIVHHLTIKSRLFILRFPFVALPAAISRDFTPKKELYIILWSIKPNSIYHNRVIAPPTGCPFYRLDLFLSRKQHTGHF